MLFPEAGLKIWLYSEATDMRKSFDGLMSLAKNKMHENPVNGELFVFINRRQTQVKILYFDRSGYCIWMKRLEEGSFKKPLASAEKTALTWTQLKLILEGIELKNIRQRKRYGA
jgi:transposase